MSHDAASASVKGKRLNWKKASEILGCGKSAFFDLVSSGALQANGIGRRNRWYWEADVKLLLSSRSGQN